MQALSAPFTLTGLQADLIEDLFDGMLHLMDMQVNASKAAWLDAALVAQSAPGLDWYQESERFGQAQFARAWSCYGEAAAIVGGLRERAEARRAS